MEVAATHERAGADVGDGGRDVDGSKAGAECKGGEAYDFEVWRELDVGDAVATHEGPGGNVADLVARAVVSDGVGEDDGAGGTRMTLPGSGGGVVRVGDLDSMAAEINDIVEKVVAVHGNGVGVLGEGGVGREE